MRVLDRPAGEQRAALFSARRQDLSGRGASPGGVEGAAGGVLALNVSPKTIRDSRSQLTDICSEAIDALKDKPIADMALRVLKKVKPYRQIEMADLMVMSNTYTAAYARTLLAATPLDQLVEEPSTADKPEQMAKLEVEMRAVERDFVVLEESYSRDTLKLQLARGYLKTLSPSVWRTTGCRSHFIFRRGRVVWCHGQLPEEVGDRD
jgi:hypothetical protein